jgi:glycosyltransferase involved in cell wall biosynthesis
MPALRPFVVFSDDWGRWPSSSQHLFRHLGRDRDVLWVETFGMRLPRPRWADVQRVLEKVGSWGGGRPADSWAPPPERLVRFAAPAPPRPAAGLVAVVRRKMAELGIEAPFLLISVPVAAGVVGRLGEAAALYYRVDDFAHWPGYAHRFIAEREALLVDRVAGLVTPGPQLDLPSFDGPRLQLPHGVDRDHFGKVGPRPAALPSGRPILLFAGRIDQRVDAALLRDLPGRVVLLGRAASPLPDGLLHLPEVAYRDLPAWLAAADVLLLPYARNPWTDSLSPLKLGEYLASGTPVVSTSLPDVVRSAGAAVHFGDGPDGFRSAVERALVSPLPSAAPPPSWAAQAARLVEFAEGLVGFRSSP